MKKHKRLICLILAIILAITSVFCWTDWKRRKSDNKREVLQSQTDEMDMDDDLKPRI